jgi:hypothetical protein
MSRRPGRDGGKVLAKCDGTVMWSAIKTSDGINDRIDDK